ncbi:MAG: hypothetical protein KF900_10095 [Bacteroidetes bacterium]|nr:hypothetical protein [Bacteroidota bacterium]
MEKDTVLKLYLTKEELIEFKSDKKIRSESLFDIITVNVVPFTKNNIQSIIMRPAYVMTKLNKERVKLNKGEFFKVVLTISLRSFQNGINKEFVSPNEIKSLNIEILNNNKRVMDKNYINIH